ncbi:MAG: nucleotidyltransferase family protein [Methanobacterium paludis]|nr:nucleotidyltransferase family protein [Methanobacterium paludis]
MTKNTDFSLKILPEDELLLLCSRTTLKSENKVKIRSLIEKGINWDHLIQKAHRHRLTQLLYWNLEDFSEYIPENVLTDLKEYFQVNAQRNLLMLGELLKTLKLLEAEDITAVSFKGPVLADYAYGNIALRQFDDIDIFVYRQDVLKIKEILMDQGYKPQFEIEGFVEKKFIKSQGEYKFFNSDKEIKLELHSEFFGLSFSFSGDLRFLYSAENFETIKIHNQKIFTLNPENMLFVLCIHASGHRWLRLSWICDIAELIQSHEINWDYTMKKAEELGIKRLLLVNLNLAVDLFDLDLPDNILKSLNSEKVNLLTFKVKAFFDSNSESMFQMADVRFNIRENRLLRIKDLLRTLFIPTNNEWKILSLYPFLLPFSHVIRFIKLLKD